MSLSKKGRFHSLLMFELSLQGQGRSGGTFHLYATVSGNTSTVFLLSLIENGPCMQGWSGGTFHLFATMSLNIRTVHLLVFNENDPCMQRRSGGTFHLYATMSLNIRTVSSLVFHEKFPVSRIGVVKLFGLVRPLEVRNFIYQISSEYRSQGGVSPCLLHVCVYT